MSARSDTSRCLEAWARRPSQASASALKSFYARKARTLSLEARAELCLALGEAAELEGHPDRARWLYAAAVSACDPARNERLYARAALRALLNGSRLGDLDLLGTIAGVVGTSKQTSRAACLGAFARGLERLLREDYPAARRAFEAAMGASWEFGDGDSEALAHHLLAQTWIRLGRVARAREHGEAAVRAARKSDSCALLLRLQLEEAMFRLRASLTPETLAGVRILALAVRKTGFPRFEALAWTKIARGVLADRASARALLSASEGLLPDGHPDLNTVRLLKAGLGRKGGSGVPANSELGRALNSLIRLAR